MPGPSLADGLFKLRRDFAKSRNKPCPCGSGAKFKKCCLIVLKRGQTPKWIEDMARRKKEASAGSDANEA